MKARTVRRALLTLAALGLSITAVAQYSYPEYTLISRGVWAENLTAPTVDSTISLLDYHSQISDQRTNAETRMWAALEELRARDPIGFRHIMEKYGITVEPFLVKTITP